MQKIHIKEGTFALVDDEYFELVCKYKWHLSKGANTSYACAFIGGKTTLMHRFILSLNDRKLIVDHKDGNGLNNTNENLRICTTKENCRNRKSNRNSTSKFIGVSYVKKRSQWIAQIMVDYKNIVLGFYENEISAAHAYNVAAKEHFAEFAKPNVIEVEGKIIQPVGSQRAKVKPKRKTITQSEYNKYAYIR